VYIHSPTERTTALRYARTTAEKAAHAWVNELTHAVFHAPMFALNADAPLNACEPTRLGPQRCKVSILS
jgi:hypothetical protein